MSRLHERKIKHQNMSPAEKESCNCDMCDGLNVYSSIRKSKNSNQTQKDVLNKIIEDVKKDVKEDDKTLS